MELLIYAAISANGYMYPSGAQNCTSSATGGQTTTVFSTPAWAFDARSNALVGTAFNQTTTTGYGMSSTKTKQGYTGYTYDFATRRIGDNNSRQLYVQNLTIASRDSSILYTCGPDYRVNSSYFQTGTKMTQHWDGDELLFTTASPTAIGQVNLTSNATMIPSSNNQLTIFDRDPAGAVVCARNGSGHDALVLKDPYGACDDAADQGNIVNVIKYAHGFGY